MIARKSALVFANSLVGALLGLVAIRLIAQYLGKDVVGPVEFALGFFGLFYFLTDLAFGAAHTKRVSEGVDEGDCLATFAVFKLAMTTLFVTFAGGIVLFVALTRRQALQDATPGVLLVVVAFYAVKSLMSIPNATFDAKRETARAQVGVLVENILRISASILLAVVFAGALLDRGPFAGQVTPKTPVVGWLVSNPSAALAGTYLVGILGGLLVALIYVRKTTRLGRFRWDILRGYAAFAFPLAAVSAVTVIASNVDRAALGFFGASGDSALFGYARRITIFIETIPVAVATLLFPTVSALSGRADSSGIREVRLLASRYVSMAVAALATFTIVLAPAIVHLFLSDEWLPAVPALRILCVFSFIYALLIPYTTALSGTGRTPALARHAITAAILNIVLNLALIPRDFAPLGFPGIRLAGLGVTGAALASLASMTTLFVLCRREAAPIAGGGEPFLLKHGAAALAMGLVLLGLSYAVLGGDFEAARWYHIPLLGAAGGATYLAALAILGEFTRADVKYFVDVVHPREMLDYVLTELHLKRRR